jgi:[NiFe] hydrogenase diaphorase moiety small subunit
VSRSVPDVETLSLDGQDLPFAPGDTILQAAHRVGRYIPHLCWHPDFPAHGSCRV